MWDWKDTILVLLCWAFSAGDLGQTHDSNRTLTHYELNPVHGQALLFVGDLSYADAYPFHDNTRWDTWGRFIERSAAYQPWIWTAGNHEVDFLPDIVRIFSSIFLPGLLTVPAICHICKESWSLSLSYNILLFCPFSNTLRLLCNVSFDELIDQKWEIFLQGEGKPFKPYRNRYHVPYRASKSTSPLWYSIKRASAYIIVLSSYSAYGNSFYLLLGSFLIGCYNCLCVGA